MELWVLLVLTLAPLIGGIAAFFIKRDDPALFKLLLSFSGAFLFAVSILHFFPVIFSSGVHAGAYVLLGFFLQLILEQLTKGVEHGHFHVHGYSKSFAYSVMAGICIHAFFDGVPVYSDEQVNHGHYMLWAISAHKIPEGFALATLLLLLGIHRNIVFVLLLLFSLTAPAGTFLTNYLSQIDPQYVQILFAIVGGLILHVSTTILFESETGAHHFTRKKLLAVIAGAGLALLTA